MKQSTLARVIWALAGTCALTGGLLWWSSAALDHVQHADVERNALATPATPDLTRPNPLMKFEVGVERVHTLEYTSRVGAANDQLISSFELRGPIKAVGLSAHPGSIVQFQFAGQLTVTSGQEATSGAIGDQLEQSVRRPFVVELAQDGRLIDVRVEPEVPSFVSRIWTAFGEYLQVVQSVSASPSNAWETEEKDATGQYLTHYDRTDPGTIVKRKLNYKTLSVNTMKEYQLIESAEQFRFDAQGYLDSLALSESVKATLTSSPLPDFQGITRLSLSNTGVRTSVQQMAGLQAQSNRMVSSADLSRETDERTMDEARIGGMTLAETFVRLEALELEGASRADQDRAGRAFVALAALLRRDPNALVAVRARLKQGGGLTNTLLAALRDASTPESQRLLASMCRADSPLNPEQRLEATQALSLVPTPKAEAIETLKSLRSDPVVGTQASYGLGSALHRLQNQNPSLAADIRTSLTQQLLAASTPGDKAIALTALGNGGDPETVAVVSRFLTDDESRVRAAAAQAVRRVPGVETDRMVARLLSDPAEDVRYSAVDAASERAFSPILSAAVLGLAVNEPDYATRAKCVNVLAQWLPNDPTIADKLKQVAANDTNADLRNVARKALGG